MDSLIPSLFASIPGVVALVVALSRRTETKIEVSFNPSIINQSHNTDDATLVGSRHADDDDDAENDPNDRWRESRN